ncbi:Arc family DNA-binding protein [Grimontia sp. NTOU-MAR1]|uniref:Arc family DNA-binding protein n=1 Tax=Grimontia sp. NTOU-MAR1 TaxID=3111011 RepID=UPI003FA37982
MKENIVQVTARLPVELKNWLVKESRVNRRSFNSELIYQVESNRNRKEEVKRNES